MSDKIRVLNNLRISIGLFIECWEFVTYIILGSEINSIFFPNIENKILNTFCTFLPIIILCIARPLGGCIFGRMANQTSQKKSFINSAFWLCLSSLAIIVLPTYQQIGFASIALILALRFVQGICYAGECGNSIAYFLINSKQNPYASIAFFPAITALSIFFCTQTNLFLKQHFSSELVLRISFAVCFILGAISFVLSTQMSFKTQTSFDRQKSLIAPKKILAFVLIYAPHVFIYNVIMIVFGKFYLLNLESKTQFNSHLSISMFINAIVILVAAKLLSQNHLKNYKFYCISAAIVLPILAYFILDKAAFILYGAIYSIATLLPPVLVLKHSTNQEIYTNISLSYNSAFTIYSLISMLLASFMGIIDYNILILLISVISLVFSYLGLFILTSEQESVSYHVNKNRAPTTI